MGHDLDAASGAAIDRMCNRVLTALRAARPAMPQPQPLERSNAEIAVELQKKGLPAARRDAAVIRRAVQENELKRRAEESSWAQARMEQPYHEQ